MRKAIVQDVNFKLLYKTIELPLHDVVDNHRHIENCSCLNPVQEMRCHRNPGWIAVKVLRQYGLFQKLYTNFVKAERWSSISPQPIFSSSRLWSSWRWNVSNIHFSKWESTSGQLIHERQFIIFSEHPTLFSYSFLTVSALVVVLKSICVLSCKKYISSSSLLLNPKITIF